MRIPEIGVLDLTSRIGGYALAQLGVTGALGPGAWEGMKVGDIVGAPHINWYRPASHSDLPQREDFSAVAVLLGPGSSAILSAVIAHQVLRAAQAVWFFLLPTALMEEAEIARFFRTNERPNYHKYQLPNSDPKALWFVLMEQFNKIPVFNQFFNEVRREESMATDLKQSMAAAMTIDGALAAALVDYRSGMCLAQAGGGLNLDLAAAGNTQVVRAKIKTMEALGIRRGIEDILITLADQYHLIRLVPNSEGLFLYLVLDKSKGNLALARYKLQDIERSLQV